MRPQEVPRKFGHQLHRLLLITSAYCGIVKHIHSNNREATVIGLWKPSAAKFCKICCRKGVGKKVLKIKYEVEEIFLNAVSVLICSLADTSRNVEKVNHKIAPLQGELSKDWMNNVHNIVVKWRNKRLQAVLIQNP